MVFSAFLEADRRRQNRNRDRAFKALQVVISFLWKLIVIVNSPPPVNEGVTLPSLAARISDDLFRSGYAPLRLVTVLASGCVVTLSGRVPTFYLKQIAQHRAIRFPDVLLVDNQIIVD